MRSRKVALLISFGLLIGIALAAQLPSAGAQSGAETTVILIEVDGLEPNDVTRETTPFLWELAHPGEGELIEEGRAGWTWQAPRSVVTAGTAANSAALLTGGYPEQSGIPADEFFITEDGSTLRLEYQAGDDGLADGAFQIGEQDTNPTLLNLVQNDAVRDMDAAAFVGNPALSAMVDDQDVPSALKWWPTNDDFESAPSPAYCDVPRQAPDSDPDTPEPEPDPEYQPPCSATDLVTLDRAVNQLGSVGGDVAFTYIHLAELGVIKRRDGDISQAPSTEQDSPEAAESVPHQLAQTDAAIAQFIQRYKDPTASPATSPKWPNTFVFIVGSHGYETSTPDKRLPAPDGEVGTSDLESWVEANGVFRYSAYGSMATIHVNAAEPGPRRQAVADIADDLMPGGSVDQACERHPVFDEPCIEELLYTREDLLPAEIANDPQKRKQHLLSERHPNWRLDHLNLDEDFKRTDPSRRSGELLIVTKPGWGAGAAVSLRGEEVGGVTPTEPHAPDPYLGVAGGPRNRAVAAIVNGPGSNGVRQVAQDHYPATAGADTGELNQNPTPKYDSLAEANAHPEDDTGTTGHERQPENVDFAPTIGALLQVGIDSEQLGGRFLQEAFLRELEFPGIEELEEPPPRPTPPPPPEVVVLPPPPPPRAPEPPPTWRFSGLLKGLRAAVGDRRGRVYPRVRRRARLDYLVLRAHFGKPLAAVKLTFYERVKKGARRTRHARESRRRRRTVVKTLATFKPFSVRRARRAKLTLKVPEVFKPTHVGVVVRRARPLNERERARAAKRRRKGKDVPDFRAYGARVGGIYKIRHARRLHTRAKRVSGRGDRRARSRR